MLFIRPLTGSFGKVAFDTNERFGFRHPEGTEVGIGNNECFWVARIDVTYDSAVESNYFGGEDHVTHRIGLMKIKGTAGIHATYRYLGAPPLVHSAGDAVHHVMERRREKNGIEFGRRDNAAFDRQTADDARRRDYIVGMQKIVVREGTRAFWSVRTVDHFSSLANQCGDGKTT